MATPDPFLKTILTELVRQRTAMSLFGVLSKTVDKVAEEMAQDLLRDPAFRAEMTQLIHDAFQAALKGLQDPAPPPEEERWRRGLP
jgi:hypothetical protein